MVYSSLRAGRVTLRPLEDGEVDRLAVILTRPGVREWWGSLNVAPMAAGTTTF